MPFLPNSSRIAERKYPSSLKLVGTASIFDLGMGQTDMAFKTISVQRTNLI